MASKVTNLKLKDGSDATIFYFDANCVELIPKGIQKQTMDLFNEVIEAGQTYPQIEQLQTLEDFEKSWLAYSCVILVSGTHSDIQDTQKVLGTFYVKPNYVGRCSHVCNAGFLVSTDSRGKGIGKILGAHYIEYAPTLGYTYSVFNLVFKSNTASWKIWDSLGFDRIGMVPGAARLKGIEGDVDAYIYGKKLV